MQLFREHGHEHPVLGDGGMCWLPHLHVAEPTPSASSTRLGDLENGAWWRSRGFSFSSKLSICQMDGARRALMTPAMRRVDQMSLAVADTQEFQRAGCRRSHSWVVCFERR